MSDANILAATLLAMAPSKDNTIIVHREFVQFTGSLEAGMMLNQVLYWTQRSTRPDKSFYKSDKEWMQELCLTRYSVRTATQQLRDRGLIRVEVHRANAAPTNHFQLDAAALASAWRDYLKSDVRLSENEQFDCLKTNNGLSEIVQTLTEITSETTQNVLFADAPTDARPTPKKPGRPKRPAHPQHAELMRRYQDALGYRIPNGVAEGKAASQLLNDGYSADHIIACYEWMKRDKFFSQMNHISLASVAKQIGAWLQKRGIQTQAVRLDEIPLSREQTLWLITQIRRFDITDDRVEPYQDAQNQRYFTPEQYNRFVAEGMPKTQPTMGAD